MIFIENGNDKIKRVSVKINEMTHRKLMALKNKDTTLQDLIDVILSNWIEDKLKLIKKGDKK